MFRPLDWRRLVGVKSFNVRRLGGGDAWPPQVLPAWVTTDNLFTSPTDLSSGWTRTALATHATATGYAGETASVMGDDSTAASQHSVTQAVSVTSGLTYIFRALVKDGAGVRGASMVLPSTRFGSTTSQIFALDGSGLVGTGTNSPGAQIANLGNGHLVISITKTATSPGSASIIFRLYNGTSVIYDGDGTSNIIVTALGLHVVS